MAPSDPRQTKFVLDEIAGSRAPGTTSPPTCRSRRSPPLHPATLEPIGPDDLAPLFPMALIGQEVSAGARDRDPGARPRRLPPLPAEPALPGPPARARARYAGPHLLQVRGRQPGRQPQAEHGASPQAFYNKEEGVDAPRDRDRRRAVGERAGVRRRAVRARGQGLHGPRELRPEAVPPDPHGDVRRGGRRQPVADDELRPHGPRARRPTARARSGSRSARRSRTPRPATTRSTRSARCSTTCSCTRRSSARRRSSRWAWPASRRTSSSAAPAAARTSPG